MKRLAVIGGVMVVLLGGAASGVNGQTARGTTTTPYELEIDPAATTAAKRAGFDLGRLVSLSADRILALVPHRAQIKIIVRLDPAHTVPETGVGGLPDPGTGDVYITLASEPRSGFTRSLVTWLPATLARNLYQSSRIRMGPGYGITLGEALVTEGLADHFVTQAYPRTPSVPWAHRAMTKKQETALWRRVKPDLIIPGGYDHQFWFWGAGGKRALPRWSGTTLAYRVVAPYLTRGRSPSKAVRTEADLVYKPYARTH